jgi:O-methyltransferase involved in polyketide biosynthesis
MTTASTSGSASSSLSSMNLLRQVMSVHAPGTVFSPAAIITCRKRFIDDKLDEALSDLDAVVILGSGVDTRGLRLARRSDIPVFEVDLPVNIARKKSAVRRVVGTVPASVHLVPLDFERDDLIATLTALQGAPAGSRLAFTYVRGDFIDGTNMYGAEILYQRFRRRRQVWKFGLDPDEIDAFVGTYVWRLVEQAGPEYYQKHYIQTAGRDLAASDLEWMAYCEKR